MSKDPKVQIDEFFCRMAAMTVMNASRCRDARRGGSTLCGMCPGFEKLKVIITEMEEESAQEVVVIREAVAANILESAARSRSKGLSRKTGSPDVYCRGCGRNNIPIMTADGLCARCSKRRKLGQPLDANLPKGRKPANRGEVK